MRIHTVAPVVALATALLWGASSADAKTLKKKPPKVSYHYVVTKVKVKVKGAPDHVAKLVRKIFVQQVNKNPRLTSTLEGAPDPKADPKGYTRYLAKKKLKSYGVNIEVLEFESITEPSPKKGLRYGVRVRLRAFGEGIPVRRMAFTGEGSATVKFDVGSKVRKRDISYGDQSAVEVAVEKALGESIAKLDAAAKAKTKKRKRRKRRKRYRKKR